MLHHAVRLQDWTAQFRSSLDYEGRVATRRQDDMSDVQTLNPKGQAAGSGAVAALCLPMHSPAAAAAAQVMEALNAAAEACGPLRDHRPLCCQVGFLKSQVSLMMLKHVMPVSTASELGLI